MQFYSYDLQDPVFNIDGLRVIVQLITKENLYGLPRDGARLRRHGSTWMIETKELSWAGQQRRAPGSVYVEFKPMDDGFRVTGKAEAEHTLRCLKIILLGLPGDTLLDDGGRRDVITASGVVRHYPGGPGVWSVGPADGPYWTFYSEDSKPRFRRLAAYMRSGGATVELIFEEDARFWKRELIMPPWVIQKTADPRVQVNHYLVHLERSLGLRRWEDRTDVPDWARQVSLVLSIHGMHWSGYIFNDYARVAKTVEAITRHIDGKHVMVFLPGWEGRYYWQYGDFRPEPMLGGPDGFADMCRRIHKTGAHLTLMFGGTCANAWFENFVHFGPHSISMTGNGLINQGNRPDWDLARNGDTGWQAWLHAGSPTWQDHLFNTIHELDSQYGIDGAFFDCWPDYWNDPRYNSFEGMWQLSRRLRQANPNMLLSTEGWTDASLAIFPVHHSGPNYDHPWMNRYCRHWAHLHRAEPSRGSTGVHELGGVPYEPQRLHSGYWPTLSFVEGTLEKAQTEIHDVIHLAKQYAEQFLQG